MNDIEKPLNLLLDFVQELNITHESVEKEKGIITQELAMYQQMADSRLFTETFKALYHNHPLNEDIGGTFESVNATDKNQLMECFTRNYHPSRMTLVVVTPHDPKSILDIVKKNQEKKKFSEPVSVIRTPFDEPENVAIEHSVIEMDVTKTKVSLAYKLKPVLKSDKERTADEWAVRCLLESHFTSLNPEYQTWLNEGLINDYFFYEVDFGKDYAVLMFVNETEDAQAFKTFIEKQLACLKNSSISLKLLSQLKKRYAGQALRLYNSSDDIASAVIKGLFSGVDYFSLIRMIETISQTQVSECFKNLDFTHSSLIEIKPLKKQ